MSSRVPKQHSLPSLQADEELNAGLKKLRDIIDSGRHSTPLFYSLSIPVRGIELCSTCPVPCVRARAVCCVLCVCV